MFQTTPFRWTSQYYFGFFFVYGVYLPFWGIWLKSQGFTPEDIGVIIGVAFASRCASNLFITPKIHRFEWLLPSLRYLSLIGAGFVLLHGVDSSDFWWILTVTIGFNCCIGPIIPLSDLVANYYARKGLFDYGRARLWGSFSFIVASTAVGWLVTHSNTDTILISALAGITVLFFISLRKPSVQLCDSGAQKSTHPSILKILFEKRTLKFVLLISCIQASHAAYYGFSSLYWESVGYSTTTVGYLWSLGVVAEIIIFAVSKNWFGHWRIQHMFLLSAIAVIVRWGLTASTHLLPFLVVIQLLHSVTYAVAHIAAIRYIQALPENKMVTFQALYNAVPLGAVMALMTAICGWGYGIYGAGIFWGMAVMGVIALFVRVESPIGTPVAERE